MLGSKSLIGFVPVILAMAYGTVVGVVTTGPVVAVYSLLVWAVPITMAIYVACHPENYVKNQRTLTATFGWGALIMGLYGIIQYFLAPAWDCAWIINSGLITQGHPFPQQIRVYSTMNSSGPFAFVLCAGLLLLIVGESRLKLPMAAFGIASLALSLVRAAWLGFIVGFVYLIWCLRGRERMRMVVLSGAISFVVVVSKPLVGPCGGGHRQEV